MPQAPAFARVQRLQADDPEQLEERLPCVVQPFETADGGGKQDDLGLRLQGSSELPAEIVVYVFAQCLQVLDHENELPSQPIRRFEDGGTSALFKVFPAPLGGQVAVRILQFAGQFSTVPLAFSREVEQRFHPEIGKIEYLVAFFHEPKRQ